MISKNKNKNKKVQGEVVPTFMGYEETWWKINF